jgi:hypothetical protein
MPISIKVGQAGNGPAQRAQVYRGAINVTTPSSTSIAFAMFARELIEEAFTGRDPELAQFDLPVDEYAAILSALKPRFIHHPESKRFLQQLLAERGCDPASTYFDVPRLRSSTSDGYLTTGIAYAWHPHRDTWYSAPLAQLNYWMPVYDVSADNAMAFHPEYFDRAIANDSPVYNYYEWNAKHRAAASSNRLVDPRLHLGRRPFADARRRRRPVQRRDRDDGRPGLRATGSGGIGARVGDAQPTGGLRCAHGRADSSCAPRASSVASSKGLPTN